MKALAKWLVPLMCIAALLPNLVSSFVWGPLNLLFATAIVGLVLFVSSRVRRLAILVLLVLAALLAVPPYPYWIYMTEGGGYSLIVNKQGLAESAGFFTGLFAFYGVLFCGIYWLSTRGNRAGIADRASNGTEA